MQAQPAHDAPVSGQAIAEGHTAEEQHGESPWAFAGKLFNFVVLAGVLVYFLRDPIRGVPGRSQHADSNGSGHGRDDEGGRCEADRRDRREVEAVAGRARHVAGAGAEEIAGEQARIEQAAAAERERLLEQTRREIDLQLRAVRRDLVTHAADLAVQVARERIRTRLTTDDQRRLLDRYLEQVTKHE